MAEVVGTAYVRIRAITNQLKRDIEDAIDKGANDADVDTAAKTLGQRFSRVFARVVKDERDSFDVSGAIASADYDRVARQIGQRISIGFERQVGPAFRQLGQDIGGDFGHQLALEAGTRLGADIDLAPLRDAFDNDNIIDAEIIEDFSVAGRAIGSGFARGAAIEISNGLGNALSDTTDEIKRNVDVDNEGRRFGDRFVEGAKKAFQAGFGPGGPIDRIMRRLGEDNARRYGGGFRGTIARYFVALAPALVAPLAGIISLVIQYVITLVGQIGFLVTAATGAGLAIGAAFGGAALAIIPIISAFAAETPALERLKKAAEDLGEAWDEVGKAVQNTLFPALEDLFDIIEQDLIPGFTRFGEAIGTTSANFVVLFGELLRSQQMQSRLNAIFTTSGLIFESFASAALNVFNGLSILFTASLPLAVRFADSIERLAINFNQFLIDSEASGGLAETLTIWYDRAVLVYNILADIAVGIWNIFTVGAQVTTPFFERFAQWAQEWREFTSGEAGQNRIAEVFENASEVAHEFNLLVTDIVERLFGSATDGENSALVQTLRSMREDWLPAIDNFLSRIAEQTGPELADLFASIGSVMQSLAESGALSATATIIAALADALRILVETPGVGQFIGLMFALSSVFRLLSILRVPQILSGIATGLSSVFGFLVANPIVAAALAGIITLVGWVQLLRTHWGNLTTVIALFIGPIQAAAFVIAAVIENFDFLKGVLEAVAGFFGRVGGAIRDGIGAALSWLLEEVLKPIGSFLSDTFSAAWERLVDVIGGAAGAIGDAATTAFGGISDAVGWVWNNVLVPFGRFLVDVFPTLWRAAGDAISWVVENVFGPLADAAQWVWHNILEPFGGWLGEVFAPIWQALQKVWNEDLFPIFQDIAGAVSDVWHNYLEPFGAWLADTFGPVWDQIWQIIEPILSAIGGAIQTLWEVIIRPFIDFIKGDFVGAFLGIVGVFSPILGIVTVLGDVFVWLWQTVLLPLWNFIVLQFSLAWQGLIIIWQTLVLPALQLLGTILLWLWQTILVPIWNFLVAVFTPVWSVLVAIWNGVVYPAIQLVGTILLWLWNNILVPVWNFISANFIPIVTALATTITGVLGFAISALGDVISFVWNSIVKPFVNFISGGFKLGIDIGKNAVNGIKNAISFIGDAANIAWKTYLEPFVNWVKGAMKTAVDIGKGAWNGVKNAINAVGDAASAAWEFVQDLIDAINDIPALPNLPGGGGGLNWRTVANPFFGADGGIFTKPTNMIIGEAGKEVLLPLTRPKRARELAAASGAYDVLLGGGHSIAFSDGAIVLQFNGAPPSPSEARRIGQQVGNGISDVLARRRISSGTRTA